MDCHLENKILLSEESEHKSLYSWSLQEFDKEGKKVGSDQIPWEWNLYFTASELRHFYSIDINKSDESGSYENTESIQESESITSILHSGTTSKDGKYLKDDVSYSMFGTNRIINRFELYICKTEAGSDKATCCIGGFISYTMEIDFRNETTDDTVVVELHLPPQQFNKIAELIKFQRVDILQICLGQVSGFYSEWSPSISTNFIKILAASKDQEVTMQEGCKIDPPRLGNVGKFSIRIIQRHKLNLMQDLRSINVDKLFEESDGYDEEQIEQQEHQDFRVCKLFCVTSRKLRQNICH